MITRARFDGSRVKNPVPRPASYGTGESNWSAVASTTPHGVRKNQCGPPSCWIDTGVNPAAFPPNKWKSASDAA